ncbi:MAG: spore gernimation protein [Bacillaceae bacterium]|nr:spore gernimation protein [Bacillaceae bacterium]
MYLGPELMRYFQQIQQQLYAQDKKIDQLNRTIQQLMQEINHLKNRQPEPPVIHNDYKFDLLKIERLDGTLNIGLNPNGAGSSIEEFDVNQSVKEPEISQQHPELYQNIQSQINDYFQHDIDQILNDIEDKYQYKLDMSYRKLIIDDVRKQVGKRILYYLKQVKLDQAKPDQLAQIQKNTVDKVKRDVEKTLDAYIRNLPRKKEDDDD